MSDVDQTTRELQTNIERMDALLREGQELTARSEKMLSEAGASPEIAQAFVARQTPQQQEEFAREVKALEQEIERDLPKQTASRPMRLKPTRQMI